MDIYKISDILETKLNTKVGIRYKSIYHGKQVMKVEGEKPIQAIYVELEIKGFRANLNNLVVVYGRSMSEFEDECKIRFFAHPDLVKSNIARGVLAKAYERKILFEGYFPRLY